MRILHCIPNLGGGGAERQLAYLAPMQARLGADVHVAYVGGGVNLDRLARGGVTLHSLRVGGNNSPKLLWDVHCLLRSVRPDILHTWLTQMDVIGGLLRRLHDVRWILSEGSSGLGYPRTFKTCLRRLLGSRADGIIANSRGGWEYWRDLVGKDVAHAVISNSIPWDEIATAHPGLPLQLDLNPQDKLIVHVGRLDAGKNVANLLLALQRLSRRGPSWKAVLCGDGPLLDQLQRLVRQLDLSERVVLAGYLPTVWSLLKRADLVATVSLFEGQPNAVLEAMACGCPVVASDIPAHREFLDEGSAVFVDPRVPDVIATGIEDVLEAPEEAARRARAARDKAANLSPATIAPQYHEFYLEVLGSDRGSAAYPQHPRRAA